MKTTMTDWEKQWMSDAPQDCMRTFVLNPEAEGGYSEYGETMLDFESTETLTEDSGQAIINLLKQDAPTPLFSGTFLRMYLFGSITDGVPVWEFEMNGEPKNFRNYYVRTANSRWFERHPTGHVDRYKHEYVCDEVLACLKDYPIRSVKTFAEGAYTFAECLDIAFQLAFRPRSVGNYTYSIKDFPGLDEPNSKLEYVNSTLYDVVTDIGRIIDAVPSMEIVYVNNKYVFELRFIDRYGLEGDVHDISYFNMKLNDAVNVERDTSAGASISNVSNLIVGWDTRYPSANGRKPSETNAEQSWEYFQLPYAIDSVSKVDVYWRYDIKNQVNYGAYKIDLYTGETIYSHGASDFFGNIMFVDPLEITYNGYSDENLYSDVTAASPKKKTLYLREYNEYVYLPSNGSDTQPTKKNTIYYTRGDNKVYLNALFNNTYRYWYNWTNQNAGQAGSVFATFTSNPASASSFLSEMQNRQFYVAVTFSVMLNGVIKGANSKPSDLTVFFNQMGQVVDIKSFGTAVNNYTKTMFGENRVLAHTYDRIGRREMYAEMPRVGSSVIDKDRGKRYVVTNISFTRRMNGGLLLATLAESRSGKSRYIIADNRQKCYAIPNESVVDSMSHTHIRCKMGVKAEFTGESDDVIDYRYLFNAFHGFTSFNELNDYRIPNFVTLNINTKQGTIKRNVDVFSSRIRQSVLLSFRMMSNSASGINNGEPQLYVDSDGQLDSIQFMYMATMYPVAYFTQTIKKDSYEILNHTTQVSWVEYGNLQIGESLIDMSFFGDLNGINQPLQLVLLSSRMRLKESLAEHTAARYNVTRVREEGVYTFTASGLTNIPEHVGWAIARGDKVILLDNFDVLTDNSVKVYYQVEVRD